MAQLNDQRFIALRLLGFTGGVNEMLLAWLQNGGATSNSLSDAWIEWLDIVTIGGVGNRSDDWHSYLIQSGYDVAANSSQTSDMELVFWQDLYT